MFSTCISSNHELYHCHYTLWSMHNVSVTKLEDSRNSTIGDISLNVDSKYAAIMWFWPIVDIIQVFKISRNDLSEPN